MLINIIRFIEIFREFLFSFQPKQNRCYQYNAEMVRYHTEHLKCAFQSLFDFAKLTYFTANSHTISSFVRVKRQFHSLSFSLLRSNSIVLIYWRQSFLLLVSLSTH